MLNMKDTSKKAVTITGVTLLLGALSMSVSAGEYQFDINTQALTSDIKINNAEDVKLETYGATATLYLNPVDDSKGPLSEAAFLSKASSVSISEFRSERGLRQQAFELQYVFNGIIFNADYTDAKLVAGSALPQGILIPNSNGEESYLLGMGVYLSDRQTLTAGYRSVEVPNARDEEEYSLAYKHLYDVEGGVAGVDAVFSYSEDVIAWQLGLDFFISNQLSLNGGVFGEDGAPDDESGYFLGVDYFFTPKVHVGLQAAGSKFDLDNEAENSKSYNINLGFRF